MLIATLILTYGLLVAGQVISGSLGSASLARSKYTASIIVQAKMESLASLFQRDPDSADLAPGSHGPEQAEIINPLDGKFLNRYAVSWTAAAVPDPRTGSALPARAITVTARPVDDTGAFNAKVALNKAISISTIISKRMDWPK